MGGFAIAVKEHKPAQLNASRQEDAELVGRFLDGDDGAFTEIVNTYHRQVYAIARRFTRNHEEADDLAQETFVKAYEHLKTFRGEAGLRTWLLRIATNLSINAKNSSRLSKDSGETPEDLRRGGVTSDPVARLIEEGHNKALYAAIEKLPPKQKRTLLLKTFRHMSCEEVAQIMGCSVGTVKANAFNALKRLKLILNPGALS